MKVISGMLKGRTILGFHNPKTRPTMDRVKESLFAMIQEQIVNSTVLDLFSGSGSLAIEALSQGAKVAYLNDNNKDAIKTIQKNIQNFALQSKSIIMNYDFKKTLKILKEKGASFDFIFLDPPYQTSYIKEALLLILEYQLINENGKIICETDSLEKILPYDSLQVVKQKKYGDKYIVIFEKV